MVDPSEAFALAAEVAGPKGDRVLRDFLSREFSGGFPQSEIERVVQGSLRMPKDAAAELMLSIMQADFRDVLPRIGRPTLCIGGARSHLGPDAMPWIASHIPGAQLVMLDARHFVYLERTGPFNQAIRTFLEKIATSPP
jgi:pimeloyl-ACP methyl ester carboxylesterase